jgi:hypothetical protein
MIKTIRKDSRYNVLSCCSSLMFDPSIVLNFWTGAGCLLCTMLKLPPQSTHNLVTGGPSLQLLHRLLYQCGVYLQLYWLAQGNSDGAIASLLPDILTATDRGWKTCVCGACTWSHDWGGVSQARYLFQVSRYERALPANLEFPKPS